MELFEWIVVIVLFAIFFISAIVTTIVIFYKKRWNYSYVVLENTGGNKYVVSQRGKCRLLPFGDGGEEIFYLRQARKWRVAYGKRIAKNQLMWVIGQDGYWYNSDFGDFDKKLLQMGVTPTDRDMRYAYASVRKGINERYHKQNFMDKYGTMVAFGMLFLCILAMIGFIWISSNQSVKIAKANKEGQIAQLETMKLSVEVLKNIDNIKSGGSGLVPTDTNTPRPVIPAS